MRWITLAVVLCGLTGPLPSLAADWTISSEGAQGGQAVQVGRAHISLPPGDWTQLGSTLFTSSAVNGELAGTNIRETLFVQTRGNIILGAAFVRASDEPIPSSWGRPAEALRGDVLYNENRVLSGHSYDYLLVSHSVWADPDRERGLSKQLSTYARDHGGVPAVWLVAIMSVTSRSDRDFVRISVLRNVSADGFSDPRTAWASSGWQHNNISGARRAFADRFIAWAKAYHQVVFDDMRG